MSYVRRTYGEAVDNSTEMATAKPAYFYYSPRQDRPQQRVERTFLDQRPGSFDDRIAYPVVSGRHTPTTAAAAAGSPRPRQLVSGKPTPAAVGDFHQEPDGTIVLVQPTPVDPYENRVKCVKFFIFGSNVVLLIVGFSLLALGAYLKADDRFRDLLSENFRQVTSKDIDPVLYIGTYIIIALALAMIIVSFFGCCGAILDHSCLLSVYFVLLMILFFMEISVMALVLMRREKIEYDVGEALDYMVQHYYQGPGMVTDVMDMLQMTFRCCGNSGCADYSYLRQNVPRSCDVACDGCRYRMFRFFRDGFIVVSVAMALVFVAEILAISFSLYLCCFIRSHPHTRRRYFYYKPASASKPHSQAGERAPVGTATVKKPL